MPCTRHLAERWAERDSAPGCPQTVWLNDGSHLDGAETESCQGEVVAGKDAASVSRRGARRAKGRWLVAVTVTTTRRPRVNPATREEYRDELLQELS